MPPVSPQQSSRGGLIAAVVTFAILFLVMSVLYFQQRGQTLQAEGNNKATEDRFKGVAPNDLTGAQFTAARDAAKENKYGVDNVVDYLLHQIDMLGTGITGQKNVPAETAEQFAKGALNETQAILKAGGIDKPGDRNLAVSQNDGLVPALRKFANGAVALANEKKASDAATAAARNENKALQDQLVQLTAAKDAEIKKAQDEAIARQKDVEALQQKQAQAMTEVGTNTSTQLNQLNEQVKVSDAKTAELNAQIKVLQDQKNKLVKTLSQYRLDPRDNMVRRADGEITQVLGNDTVLINLGFGDALPAGLTFEVYDATIGIPSLNADIAGLDDETARQNRNANVRLTVAASAAGPAGKAGAAAGPDRYETALPSGFKGSIEVTRIDANHAALCRIIKTERGEKLRPGDKIANLVYNPKVKSRMAVFGEFDLDYNGVTTASDTARVKQLITQWGGQLMPAATAADIGPDVDFVVMGVQPTVPT
ncbi:MAG: hypothetical protein JWO31_546, partial [Phycisphaerales bacterium]|nr:hypothetical protein [Phycisphaerales bacterium]